MDKRIQKIDHLVKNYLSKSRSEILKLWGKPLKESDNDTWFYEKKSFGIFKDEIAFIFKNDLVEDVMISEFVLGISLYNIFYYKDETCQYKVVKLF